MSTTQSNTQGTTMKPELVKTGDGSYDVIVDGVRFGSVQRDTSSYALSSGTSRVAYGYTNRTEWNWTMSNVLREQMVAKSQGMETRQSRWYYSRFRSVGYTTRKQAVVSLTETVGSI